MRQLRTLDRRKQFDDWWHGFVDAAVAGGASAFIGAPTLAIMDAHLTIWTGEFWRNALAFFIAGALWEGMQYLQGRPSPWFEPRKKEESE